jgi:type I site-specific restriction endonuclease
MNNEFELFKGTTFSDLMRDVYHNSKKKSRQIDTLIQELQPFVKNIGDATVIVPLIKDYLEVSVKNDDALVKLAAIVQRLASASNKDEDGNEFGISDDERRRLLEEAESEIKSIQKSAVAVNPVQEQKKDLDGSGNIRSGSY